MKVKKADRNLGILVLLFVFFHGSGVVSQSLTPTKTDRIPIVDGVHLSASIFLPAGHDRPLPTILVLTPYGKNNLGGFPKEANSRGYAVLGVDMRGRGESEGSNVVIFQSGGWTGPRDGHVILRWITEQPWSNGRVATWGGSAVGITQNMLAPDAPSSLQAQFVEVASSNLYEQCMYEGGAFRQSMIEGWLLATGMTKGNLDTFRSHPSYDSFWETMDPESVADRTVAPGIFVGGWYDIFCQGTIDSFTSIQSRGGPKAKGRCRLIMGPWGHGSFKEIKYPAVGNKRPEAANALRYFDHLLKDESNGVADDKAVHYFVMTDPEAEEGLGNHWQSRDDWPPPHTPEAWYFHADGTMTKSVSSGDESRTYRYDPKEPVPTVGGQNLIPPLGPMDQRKVESREDVLVFTTEVFQEPLEITGRMMAQLFVSSDCPDTDFTVKLCDVYPDGRSMLVTDGIRRAKYRRSFEKPEPLIAGRVESVDVDLWSTSLVVAPGHRLRVSISSSNHPRFDANPNTGKASWEEKEPRVATNTIYLSTEHPSKITLPIVKQASDEGKGS